MTDGREDILRYLDEHGVEQKDLAPRRAVRRRAAIANPAIDSTCRIDLHGLTQIQAAALFRRTVERCQRTGVRSILVIHGQGIHSAPEQGAVLKTMVRQMLDGELRETVRDYKTAPVHQGGGGATVVSLVKAGGRRFDSRA